MEWNWIEFFAVVFGLIPIYLNVREIVWGWPTSIIGSILLGLIAYQAQLYASVGLNVVYVIMGFYGWYQWLYGGKNQSKLQVTRTGTSLLFLLIVLGIIGTAGIGYFFQRTTDADIPYWDAFGTAFSLVGTYMLAKKKHENWLLWIVVDAIFVGIYFTKELYLLALLYFLYLGLATYGYYQWRQSLAIAHD
ncbi:nicotinamide riboside transporter PnuC [Tunicatimonas pelagia]|uniref:nicotinamide riboside transporter PnuC n=1 Tax=Tunicatimonas pelagia TaxID=931531 RepID=UPI00266711EE|nr:nicotinamide riboside transporter PnuC [Tunicatimonas pelagia]WKN41809.1 nicotinamide riboside transporter PnuC [Tunicatimonas pelagia]